MSSARDSEPGLFCLHITLCDDRSGMLKMGEFMMDTFVVSGVDR